MRYGTSDGNEVYEITIPAGQMSVTATFGIGDFELIQVQYGGLVLDTGAHDIAVENVPAVADLATATYLKWGNTTSVLLTDTNGVITDIPKATASSLKAALQAAVAAGTRFRSIRITGHGDLNVFYLGEDKVKVVDNKVMLPGFDDITPLLKSTMTPFGEICLQCCSTAGDTGGLPDGQGSIACDLSSALPGIFVSGQKGEVLRVGRNSTITHPKSFFFGWIFLSERAFSDGVPLFPGQ